MVRKVHLSQLQDNLSLSSHEGEGVKPGNVCISLKKRGKLFCHLNVSMRSQAKFYDNRSSKSELVVVWTTGNAALVGL